jgi:hypothetical protein
VSRVGDDFRVGWLRPELCEVGTLLFAAPSERGEHMIPVSSPPDTNRVVIVLFKDETGVIGGTYRYKKNKWVGTASGVSHEMPTTAVWIECPFQI